jgi:hypothetical protein
MSVIRGDKYMIDAYQPAWPSDRTHATTTNQAARTTTARSERPFNRPRDGSHVRPSAPRPQSHNAGALTHERTTLLKLVPFS